MLFVVLRQQQIRMSTTIFKAMIAIKTGNPIIFAFHPSAQESSKRAAEVVLEAAMKAGAPKDIIQWIEVPSIEATKQLMNHKGIALSSSNRWFGHG